MSGLGSAIDELASEDLAGLPDGRLSADLIELQRLQVRLDAEGHRRVAAWDRRRAWAADGIVSGPAWLRHRLGLSHAAASTTVRTARALTTLPATAAAFADGRVDGPRLRLLVDAAQELPAAFAEHEAVLVETAETLDPRRLRVVLDRWRHDVDWAAATTHGNLLHARRRLHLSRSLDGCWHLSGLLDPEGGAVLDATLQAFTAADGPSEPARTPAQRRADALIQLASGTPASERAHLSVTVDLATLERRAGYRCELDTCGEPIGGETARRLACDAQVSRVITCGRSEPLDVGRATRVVSPAIRRALAVRDGGCRYPGCDRPPSWTDAHHLTHWIDGGTTTLSNLVLLCRRHHRLVHEGGHQLELRSRADRAPP
jgi:hypothetical protein